jgi:hypothetical protein
VTVDVQNEDGVPANALPPKKLPNRPGPEIPGGGGGNTPTNPGGGGGTTNLAPALTRLKLSHASFRKGRRTTIGFRLSEAAKVTLTFERKLSGRRVHGRCVKPKRGARANCTRYMPVRTGLRFQGRAGANSISFDGRLSRRSALAVGSYRLTLTATDATGKRSKAARIGFRLLPGATQSQARALRAVMLGWF